jgi:uncharacterized protein (TIGR03067 family)
VATPGKARQKGRGFFLLLALRTARIQVRGCFMKILAVASLFVWGFLAQEDQKAIHGKWSVREYDQNGQKPDPGILKRMQVFIKDGKITIRPKLIAQYKPVFKDGRTDKEVVFSTDEANADDMKFRLDPEKGWIDLGEGKTSKGIFLLEGDTLKICFPAPDKKRPKKFPDQPKNGVVRMVLQKAGK